MLDLASYHFRIFNFMIKEKVNQVSGTILKLFGFFMFSLAVGGGLGYLLITYLNFDIVHRKGTVGSEVVKANIESIPHQLPLVADGPVKNVILFIGDGMGLGQITATRYRYYGPTGRLHMERMPVTALVNTFAAKDQLITDSGAGATALATGHKTNIGMLGVTP